MENFKLLKIIGKGNVGYVWKVYNKKTQRLYALKEMKKNIIRNKKLQESVNRERKILSELHSPFITKIYTAFQDNDSVFLLMDYFPGGNLRYHINRKRSFTESQIRFIAACTIEALDCMHKQDMIHKDIKPENLIFDIEGYVCICDFGITLYSYEVTTSQMNGTLVYMSPEQIRGRMISYECDFYALGCILHELMTGKMLFEQISPQIIKDELISNRVMTVNTEECFLIYSNSLVSLVNSLLVKEPKMRLGIHGPQEIRNHAFFKGFDWEALRNRTMKAPFVPRVNQDLILNTYVLDFLTEERLNWYYQLKRKLGNIIKKKDEFH